MDIEEIMKVIGTLSNKYMLNLLAIINILVFI